MRILSIVLLSIILSVSVAFGSDFTESQYFKYWTDSTCSNIIGIMPHIEINTTPNSKVCVQWYENGITAMPPNSTIEMGPYCRITNSEGKTFFAMHEPFLNSIPITEPDCTFNGSVDLTIYDIGLMVLSIDGVAPNLPYVSVVF